MNESAQHGGSSATAPEKIGAASLSSLTERIGSLAPTPGGGSVAAAVVALAASLGEMTARYALKRTPANPNLQEIVRMMGDLRERGLLLADADMEAYGRYVLTTGISKQIDMAVRRDLKRAALSNAADVPTELVSIAARIAEAGTGLFDNGNPSLRSDAFTVTVLAAAVAQSGARLVAENLGWTPNDPRIAESRRLALQAAAAVARITNSHDPQNGIKP